MQHTGRSLLQIKETPGAADSELCIEPKMPQNTEASPVQATTPSAPGSRTSALRKDV